MSINFDPKVDNRGDQIVTGVTSGNSVGTRHLGGQRIGEQAQREHEEEDTGDAAESEHG